LTETNNDIKDSESDNNVDNIESEFYYALGHDIRRQILKIIGESGFTSFTKLKKELQVSTGTIYHHLDALSKLIEQQKNKKYYFTELGEIAFNSLENNKKELEFPKNSKDRIFLPYLKNLTKFLAKIIDSESKANRIYLGIVSIIILILGMIFCELNKFYSILLFFRQFQPINFPLLYGLSFLFNFGIFFLLTEVLSRLFYRKSKNSLILFLIFPLIFLPIDLYLFIHYIFVVLEITEISVIYLIDKIFLVFFQALSIMFLSYFLGEIKELRLEYGLIISLLIHLGGFTFIILFISF